MSELDQPKIENLRRIAAYLKSMTPCLACTVEGQEHTCLFYHANWAGREILKTIDREGWVTQKLMPKPGAPRKRRWIVTEPSVDEIVARFEVGMNGRRVDAFNTIFSPELRALIADWRKRGEALADIGNQKPWAETSPDDLWIFHDYMRDRANAAITSAPAREKAE